MRLVGSQGGVLDIYAGAYDGYSVTLWFRWHPNPAFPRLYFAWPDGLVFEMLSAGEYSREYACPAPFGSTGYEYFSAHECTDGTCSVISSVMATSFPIDQPPPFQPFPLETILIGVGIVVALVLVGVVYATRS